MNGLMDIGQENRWLDGLNGYMDEGVWWSSGDW